MIGNVWAILHDPMLYPSPESFDPAHFISTAEGGTYPADACKSGEAPFPEVSFGFGRRVCPGRALGKTNVWLTAANVLATYDITPAKDAAGDDVPIVETWTSGIIQRPTSFGCTIKPRKGRLLRT